MGQSASGKAAWRWARTCAAGRCSAGSSGGGQRPDRAVRILLWPRSNRFQTRCQVRSLRWPSAARMAARTLPATAHWRNAHSAAVVRLSRRILSASQTLKVCPQPGRALRLLQKTRRARSVLCRGLLSSKPQQTAVPNQRTDDLAVRTGRQLEPLGNRVPLLVGAVKPFGPRGPCLRENRNSTDVAEVRGSGGVRERFWCGVRGAG